MRKWQRTILSRALKGRRKHMGWTLRETSGRFGVSFATLSRVERRCGDPDADTLLALMRMLGLSVKEMTSRGYWRSIA